MIKREILHERRKKREMARELEIKSQKSAHTKREKMPWHDHQGLVFDQTSFTLFGREDVTSFSLISSMIHEYWL